MLRGPWGGTPPKVFEEQRGVQFGWDRWVASSWALCCVEDKFVPSPAAEPTAQPLTVQRRLSSSNTSHGPSNWTPDRGNSRTPVLTQSPGVSG